MIEYQGNSIKSKTTTTNKKEPVKRVTKGSVKKKKQSELKKIAGSIIANEASSIKDYAVYEVIIPVIKDTVTQLIKGSIDMMFYGEVRSSSTRSSSRSGTNASRVSYRDYYDDKRERRREPSPSRRFSYDDVEFETREDANNVLGAMDDILEEYRSVSVGEFFELAGYSGNGYTDNNYGWTDLRDAEVVRNRQGGFEIRLPRARVIKK